MEIAATGQSSDGGTKFGAEGPADQPSTWLSRLSTGYFGVIIKSLTVDGWVVICILAVMAVMSWSVMINKISYLNGISKGNALFMKEWSRVAADLTALDDAEEEPLQKMGARTRRRSGRCALASVYRINRIPEKNRHRLAGRISEFGIMKSLFGTLDPSHSGEPGRRPRA